jgi:hypothetical protein
MTAFARFGSNSISTRMASRARTVGTLSGVCSVTKGIFQPTAVGPVMALLTGTIFANTRQRPATLVLLLRGVAKGESTARLARELGVSRQQLHTLRQRMQANLHETAPTAVMVGTACEADELDQNAGEKKHPTARPHRSAPAARQ